MKKNEQKVNSRQKEILKETMFLIRQGGLQAVTMKKVADRVGIKEPSAYRYFPDKTKLLIGIINSIKKTLLAPLYKIKCSEETPSIRLNKIVTRHIKTVLKLNGLPVVFMAEIASSKKHDLIKHIKLIFEEYQQILDETIMEINPNLSHSSVQEYSMLFIGMSASLAIQKRLGIKSDVEKDIFKSLLPITIQNICDTKNNKNEIT